MTGVTRCLSAACLLVILSVADARPMLCARVNGIVASRTACRKHEHEVSVATLPASRAALTTTRSEPITLAQTGSKIAELTLLGEPSGSYVVLATVTLRNSGQVADTASCALVVQAPGRTDPFGLRLADSSIVVNGGATATTTLLGGLPTLDPSKLQNGSGAVALWCFASTPGASFASGATSLAAIPVEDLKAQ
jgi:hypothetical protein